MTQKEVEARIVKIALRNENETLKTLKAIHAMHSQTKRNVKKNIRALLGGYTIPDNGRVDFPRLMLPLTTREVADYKARVRDMQEIADGEYYVYHFIEKFLKKPPKNRLHAILLYALIDMAMFGQFWLDTADNDLNATTANTFDDYLEINEQRTEEPPVTSVMDTLWSDGYSNKSPKDRIIDNNDKVIIALMLLLEKEMVAQPTIREVERVIDERFRVQGNDINRHMQTYTTLATNQGLLMAYIYLGECLKHISVLDNRTTDLCRARNGRVFHVSEAVYGVTIPPLHHWCRSIVVPAPCSEITVTER